jgi:Tfp pilus assembly protein PilO
MRAVRERPRVTIAKFLAIALVFVLGIAFAGVLSEDEPDVPPATATALERARGAADTRAADLAEARERTEQLEKRVALLERRLRASGTRSRRLTRALRSARRQISELEP